MVRQTFLYILVYAITRQLGHLPARKSGSGEGRKEGREEGGKGGGLHYVVSSSDQIFIPTSEKYDSRPGTDSQ